LRKKFVKFYVWSIASYGAETWTIRAVDQKHLESFEMWCWRKMEKISWADHVRNEEMRNGLSPSDFDLFQKLKKPLCGKRFQKN
jgi:hypothetical protein